MLILLGTKPFSQCNSCMSGLKHNSLNERYTAAIMPYGDFYSDASNANYMGAGFNFTLMKYLRKTGRKRN